MPIDNSALDMLNGGGKTAKFPEVGDTIKGRVVSAEATQQTDLDTGKLKFWDDGNPMMQLVITLETDERDPDDATDDGHRRVFCKGEMLKAVRAALAGKKLEEGATLAIQYTGDGEAKKKGFNPPKLYKAEYAPAPAVAASAQSLI